MTKAAFAALAALIAFASTPAHASRNPTNQPFFGFDAAARPAYPLKTHANRPESRAHARAAERPRHRSYRLNARRGRSGRPYGGVFWHGGYGPRPAAWCGWEMRHLVKTDPGPAYNLARNWMHYGRPAGGPAAGVIVVWEHHVGLIVRRTGTQWIVKSGNDGHALRTRARSLGGAIAFRFPER